MHFQPTEHDPVRLYFKAWLHNLQHWLLKHAHRDNSLRRINDWRMGAWQCPCAQQLGAPQAIWHNPPQIIVTVMCPCKKVWDVVDGQHTQTAH